MRSVLQNTMNGPNTILFRPECSRGFYKLREPCLTTATPSTKVDRLIMRNILGSTGSVSINYGLDFISVLQRSEQLWPSSASLAFADLHLPRPGHRDAHRHASKSREALLLRDDRQDGACASPRCGAPSNPAACGGARTSPRPCPLRARQDGESRGFTVTHGEGGMSPDLGRHQLSGLVAEAFQAGAVLQAVAPTNTSVSGGR